MRVGEMANGPIELVDGSELVITTEPVKGRPGMVSTSYAAVPAGCEEG